MIIEFAPPAQVLNLNDRMHWGARSELTALWRHAAFVHGINAAKHAIDDAPNRRFAWVRPYSPSTVKVTFPVRSTKTRRDPHNWIASVKPIVDGLVDAKFWPDDTAEWVTVVEPEFWTGRNVLVEICPRGQ